MYDEEVIFDTPVQKGKGNKWCRLAAKDLVSLHTAAYKLGVKRFSFVSNSGKPYYVIKSDKIIGRAIIAGATKVTRNYLSLYLIHHYGNQAGLGTR